MIAQLIQLGGALLLLAGFAGAQLGWLDVKSGRYLGLNAIGSGILATLAILDRQWGFILLESAWTAVSIAGMISILIRRRELDSNS